MGVEAGAPIRWATNAPAHWPPLVTPAPPISNEENPVLAPMFFADAMIAALNEAGATLDLHDILLALPYPDGLLDIPFRVLDGGTVVPIFDYSKVDEEAGARFAGIAELEATGDPPLDSVHASPGLATKP